MKKYIPILIIASIILITGCQPSGNAERTQLGESIVEITETKFTPSANGLITEKQADKYILIAKALNEAIWEQVDIMQKFYDKYNISGKEEIVTLEKNEKAMAEWDNIIKKWGTSESNIYKKIGMSSDEFDWVAASLIDKKNAVIQQKIEKALTTEETEE